MDINRLGTLTGLAEYRQTNQRLSESLERLSSGEKVGEAKQNPSLWGDVEQLKQYAATLTGISDNLNRASSSVRIALESMDVSRQHLDQLDEKLNAAFAAPAGSEERAYNLAEYNRLHSLLDDTARAPDAGARRLLDNPETFSEAGDFKVRAGDNGFMLTLKSREIHTGASGLDLPKAGEARPSDLAADPMAVPIIADLSQATDEEIQAMIAHLEEAQDDLVAKTKALSVDAGGIEKAINFNEAFISRNEILVSELNAVDQTAEAVIANSMSLKNSLALNGLAGLRDTHSMALRLLQS